MKVQMQGQQLRLRISEAELAQLQSGKTLANLTKLPSGVNCLQALKTGAQVRWTGAAGDWCFELSQAALEDYVSGLPCRDALVFMMPVPESDAIEIHFEVDVRDSVRTRRARPAG